MSGAGPSKDGSAHGQPVCGLTPGCGGAPWMSPGRLNSPRVIVAASVLSVTNEERLALLSSLSGYSHFSSFRPSLESQDQKSWCHFALSSLLLLFSLVSKSDSLHLRYFDRILT